MSEINPTTVVVKCQNPSCKANIHISVGKDPGGVNDYGGWILECKNCQTKFPYDVKNPIDYSTIENGAVILDAWDNDIPDSKKELLKEYGLEAATEGPPLDQVLFVQTGEREKATFSDIEENIFFCPQCGHHIEPVLYSELQDKLTLINNSIKAYLPFFPKGRYGHPDSIIISVNFTCACGFATKAILFKVFQETELPIQDVHELILIDILGAKLEATIDGIYNRDSCLAILQKLLIRWQVYYNRVFLVVPFIGFQYENSREQRVDLWNWILKNTLPNKTALLTRKATFTSFLEGAAQTGMDISVLKDYGLLNPMLDKLAEKKALFKVLVGSFNIHEGGYMENVHFKSYDFGDFFRKYILNMDIVFDPQKIDEDGEFLFINESPENNKFGCQVERYTSSKKEKIYELVNK